MIGSLIALFARVRSVPHAQAGRGLGQCLCCITQAGKLFPQHMNLLHRRETLGKGSRASSTIPQREERCVQCFPGYDVKHVGRRYGNYVDIMHSGNFLTRYAHCQCLLVREGQVRIGIPHSYETVRKEAVWFWHPCSLVRLFLFGRVWLRLGSLI